MKMLLPLLCLAGAAVAQEGPRVSLPEPPGPENAMFVTMAPGVGPAATIGYFGVEAALDEKVVTGAPYSADAVTEVVRTLADGNRIANTNKSSFYRDSQGRTRREMSFQPMGAIAPSGTPPRMIVISDPVAKVKYTLEENNHTAHKIPTAVRAERSHTFVQPPAKTQWFTKAVPSVPARKMAGDFKSENLGTQTVSGVAAQGTRTTHTIPVGAIGNEREIEIVTETWYSPELQTVVMRKTTNPMDGDTTFQLTNIQRGDPPQSMFEVPPDYTLVDDGGPRKFEYFVRKPGAP